MIEKIPFSDVEITGGFWKKRQDLNRSTTIYAVRDRFAETGRFDAFRCDWKEGDPNRPHIYWDSDVAKWIEAVAYLVEKHPEPALEAAVEDVIDQIEKNQWDDGYFNICFSQFEPQNRFTRRTDHELYCAGHLIEAAIAWYRATGRPRFLQCMCRYADLIERVFAIEKSAAFATPGHEEIELALVKLYEATGDERYLKLSQFFVETRGTTAEPDDSDYNAAQTQSHLPVREQKTAEGHAVRAMYLYSAMADLARHTGDESLRAACETLFQNITGRRMYITGGTGSSAIGEAFTYDFDLPNYTAYEYYTDSTGTIDPTSQQAKMGSYEANSALHAQGAGEEVVAKLKAMLEMAAQGYDMEGTCPVCGVSADNFIPYEEKKTTFRKDTDEKFDKVFQYISGHEEVSQKISL